MAKENDLQSVVSIIGTVVSVIVVLLGTAAGWGMLKSRISSLERTTIRLDKEIEDLEDSKIDKEDHLYIIQEMKSNYKEIKKDLRAIREKMLERKN
jgi:flagellar capping protein FliD